ncbi:L-aspartate oxidase [Candidatus Sumerlaeota bacterium]|nr:L-aspartate oxidase [Candidatus Sumerlaeota bacterium]
MQDQPADVLILGTGIAGCTAALTAAEAGAQVTLITRAEEPEDANTRWAQGGIIYEGEGDSPQLLAEDIQEAGGRICNPKAVRQLSKLGPRLVREVLIEQVGVEFDRDSADELHRTEEGAHAMPRILHVADLTGKAIELQLLKVVQQHPNIRLLTRHTAIDLLTLSHHSNVAADHYRKPACFGAYVLNQQTGRVEAMLAKHTVLTTGGIGQIFLHTTNPAGARGDGIAMAYRAGVRLLNMEFIQFHPTMLYHRNAESFLISEAVRGEGGELVTHRGEAFMQRYHERGSLAPRDVVSRAIHNEMLIDGGPCVYLDITHKDAAWLEQRFPTIYHRCAELGIDIAKQPIPVVPAAHYACGGVWVDLKGRTNMRRLWAAGETTCTGLHGANRLASSSLLEGLVWGWRCGGEIGKLVHEQDYYYPEIDPWQYQTQEVDPALIKQDWLTIKQTMWNYVGLVRTNRRMKRAYRILRGLRQEVEDFYESARMTDEMIGLRNGVITALAVLHGAYENRKSCGAHYRED